MTKQDLVNYLRLNVNVKDPDSNERDELYLKYTDDDLVLTIEMAKTRAFADESLDDFPDEYMYPLMLLSKRELYLALAVRHANYIDIGADDNNYLKKSQWFDHYMKLAADAMKDYTDYLDEGGAGSNTLTSADVYLANRYYTNYNYEKANLPYLKAKIDKTTFNSIEVSWKFSVDRFLAVNLYISKYAIADMYELGKSQVSELAKNVATVKDPHLTHCRISGCEENTTYFILVTITDWTGRTVYDEKQVTTASASDESSTGVVEVSL